MLERLLERIAISPYKDNFILKGGLLIAAIVGLNSRATMDMDATIKGFLLSKKSVKEMFDNLCKIQVDDGVEFTFRNMEEIRESDEYNGYRISLFANYPPMSVPLKLDITTGDIITPKEIQYKYRLLLEDRDINVLAYNLETVLAEKLETVISRGDLNTRPRDYYDIYILLKLQSATIETEKLKAALLATAEKRGSLNVLLNYDKTMQIVETSEIMRKHWSNYQDSFEYATEISFSICCNSVSHIMRKLFR